MNKKIIYSILTIFLMSIVAQTASAQAPNTGFEWKSGQPVSFQINPTNSGLTSAQIGNAIFNAMSAWDTQSPYYDLFSGYSTNYNRGFAQDGVNAIVWQPMGLLGPSAITQPYVNTGTGKITEVDIKFNSNLPWTVDGITGLDVQGIGTHEIGHAIGLGEDTNCPLCTMFPVGGNGILSRTLEQGDINAVKKQYCTGDVNGDNIVDITDASKVQLAWGTSSGQPGYNKDADINGDNIIDITDASKVQNNWGHVC